MGGHFPRMSKDPLDLHAVGFIWQAPESWSQLTGSLAGQRIRARLVWSLRFHRTVNASNLFRVVRVAMCPIAVYDLRRAVGRFFIFNQYFLKEYVVFNQSD